MTEYDKNPRMEKSGKKILTKKNMRKSPDNIRYMDTLIKDKEYGRKISHIIDMSLKML
jgi:hypothetical protein